MGGGKPISDLVLGEPLKSAVVDLLSWGSERQEHHHVSEVHRLPPSCRSDLGKRHVRPGHLDRTKATPPTRDPLNRLERKREPRDETKAIAYDDLETLLSRPDVELRGRTL